MNSQKTLTKKEKIVEEIIFDDPRIFAKAQEIAQILITEKPSPQTSV